MSPTATPEILTDALWPVNRHCIEGFTDHIESNHRQHERRARRNDGLGVSRGFEGAVSAAVCFQHDQSDISHT